jgi:hypothetical protein
MITNMDKILVSLSPLLPVHVGQATNMGGGGNPAAVGPVLNETNNSNLNFMKLPPLLVA